MKRMMTGIAAVAMIMGTASMSFGEPKVAQRQERQQQRIGQGVKSGSLTPNETSHLESREHNLNQEVRADRQANGGKLTGAEKQQVNNQQNHISNAIYRDKHNAANQQQ